MTRLLPIRWLALPALVVAALFVAGFVIQAKGDAPRPPRFVVVVDSTSGRDADVIASATSAVRAARDADGVSDDRSPRHLADEQQTAAGLRVGEQEQIVLAHTRTHVEPGSHPIQVATAAAGHVAPSQGLAHPVDERHGCDVEDRAEARVVDQAELGA